MGPTFRDGTIVYNRVSSVRDHPLGWTDRQKVSAIGAHRTQYRLSADMFPKAALKEMLGHEYFVRVIPTVQIETEL